MEKARKLGKLWGVTLKEICRVDEYMVLVREETEENVLEHQSKQLDGDKRLLESRGKQGTKLWSRARICLEGDKQQCDTWLQITNMVG